MPDLGMISEVAVTLFCDRRAGRKIERQFTWQQLHDEVATVSRPRKDDLPWLKLAQFGDLRTEKGSLRHDANVLSITGVEADYDGEELGWQHAVDLLSHYGIRALVYTSPSHCPDRPRWRVLCPTSRPLPPAERTRFMAHLDAIFGGIFARESWTLSQAYYYGSVAGNPHHHVEVIEGAPIDLVQSEVSAEFGAADRAPSSTIRPQPEGGRSEAALLTDLVSGTGYHVATVSLAGRWALQEVPYFDARMRLIEAFEAVPVAKRDNRWHQRRADLDRCLHDIYGKEAAKKDLASGPAPPMAALPVHTLGALLDDDSPMPADILAPRLLTPGGILVLGGAPKVGKSDLLISLLVHAAAGVPFLRFAPPRPLRVLYLQAEIQYHYLRERLHNLRLDPDVLIHARENLFVTPKLRMLLDQNGLELVIAAIREHFVGAAPDIICLDPIRNLFDGGPDGEGENDNTAMMYFLQERVEALREAVAPNAGVILCHHTKKLTKKALLEDPFMALSGASALRSFYSSGMIMFRPEEDQPVRRLEIELRNGPALDAMLIDKRHGRWVELDPSSERLVRKDLGAKLDAERVRRHDVILQSLADEAAAGRLYSITAFAEAFENRGGLGGADTIRGRINVLASKGYIKFRRDASEFGLRYTSSKFGYLVVEGMVLRLDDEVVDPETGEVSRASARVLPSHYKCPLSGTVLPVENPEIWVHHDDGETP